MLKIRNHPIKGVILDMDGVLWRSDTPLCNIKQIFEDFTENHVKIMMATNNGLRTVDEYVEKFSKFDIMIEPWQVVTSAIATAALLKQSFPSGRFNLHHG